MADTGKAFAYSEDEIPVYMADEHFRARGISRVKELTVLKDSMIRMDIIPEHYEKNLSLNVRKMREDPTVVDPEGKVLKDVTFSSPTDAASFVAARHRSGPEAWKTAEGVTLKKLKY